MIGSRFYYQTLGRALMRGFAVIGFVVCLTLVPAPHLAAAFRVLAAVVAFAYLYVNWHYGGGRGVRVSHAGIHVRRWFRWRFIPWREVKRFRIKRRSLSPPVFVELVSGELKMLPLTQGRQVAWEDGKSRDIVSRLNEDLALALQNGEPGPIPD